MRAKTRRIAMTCAAAAVAACLSWTMYGRGIERPDAAVKLVGNGQLCSGGKGKFRLPKRVKPGYRNTGRRR